MTRRRKKNKDILFVDYFDEWVKTYKEGLVADVTLEKYLINGEALRGICPRLFLDEMDRRDYQNIINEYAKTREKVTVMNFHHQIKGCLKDAFHDGIIDKDPTYRAVMKGVEPRKKKRKYLHGDELKKLINVLDLKQEINIDWFILVVAKTGLRFAEALALTPGDFDFKSQTLRVDKSIDYKSSKMEFTRTKNPSSIREIAIDWQLVGQFAPLIKELPTDKPIFVEDGKRVFNSTYNKYLKRKCKEADVTVITFHALRHTHASVLLAAGVSLHSIAERLGHSDVTTTQETYTHIIKELEQQDDQKMIGALMALT